MNVKIDWIWVSADFDKLRFHICKRVATARTREAAARNCAVGDTEVPHKALLPQSAMSSSTIRERAA